MEFNVADLTEAAADAVPERDALVAGEVRHSFAALDQRANRLAHHLSENGVKAGDHVGVYAYNCAEYVEAMLACYKLRAVPINVNFRYVEQELQYLFDNADLVAVVHQRQFTPRIAAVRERLPKLRHFVAIDDQSGEDIAGLGSVPYEHALAGARPDRDFELRSPDDLYVLYTGGTTGMPKGVIWRQEDVIFALGGGIDHVTGEPARRPEDMTAKTANPPLTMMVIPPLMHGAAQWAVLIGLFIGQKTVLYANPHFDADEVWRLVERERVNVLYFTGDAMARPLADRLTRSFDDYDVSSMVALASTAAIFSPSVKAQLKEKLPNLVITDSLGSSETGFNGTAMYDAADETKREGVGVRLNPGRDTIVLDDSLRPVAPGSDTIGKVARGGNIPLGYHKDPEKTAATFIEVEGKRYSMPGDLAKVEADGSITLLGRGDVCINSGGEKIYPEEVEAALKSHEDVFDALVVGIPDERWGEKVAAVVQPRPGKTPLLESLNDHCRTRVARYKVPRVLHLVERIQRQPSGKPDYPWAKRVATEALG
jgi:acyl-CoA synthetase (AMP-forming)/AMP-acid ligase II